LTAEYLPYMSEAEEWRGMRRGRQRGWDCHCTRTPVPEVLKGEVPAGGLQDIRPGAHQGRAFNSQGKWNGLPNLIIYYVRYHLLPGGDGGHFLKLMVDKYQW